MILVRFIARGVCFILVYFFMAMSFVGALHIFLYALSYVTQFICGDDAASFTAHWSFTKALLVTIISSAASFVSFIPTSLLDEDLDVNKPK